MLVEDELFGVADQRSRWLCPYCRRLQKTISLDAAADSAGSEEEDAGEAKTDDSVEKIAEIDTHIGAAMSGLVADARTLVDHARVEAQNHTFTYDEPIGVEALTQGE